MRTLSIIFFTAFILICLTLTVKAQYSWTKSVNNPVLRRGNLAPSNPNEYQYLFGPCVLYDSIMHIYRMWFTSYSWYGYLSEGMEQSHECISCAISLDGEKWYIDVKNPVLKGVAGTWETDLQCPRVIHDATGYKMYYTAVQGSSMQLALATSADGITWTQYGNGPIIPAGVAGSWDGMAQCFCDVSRLVQISMAKNVAQKRRLNQS